MIFLIEPIKTLDNNIYKFIFKLKAELTQVITEVK